MTITNLVLVDTCLWVSFFNRPSSDVKRVIDELLDEGRVALIGPIVTEILLGFRRDAEADWVASELRGVELIELNWIDWREAARLGRQLAAKGHTLPLSDLVLCAVATRRNLAVYSTDPHFDLVPNLPRFVPSAKP